MSIALKDIFGMEQPKQGIVPPSVYVEIKFADSARIVSIPAKDPDERINHMRRRLLTRIYGDIAQDLEHFIATAFPDGLPALNPEAAHLLEIVRQKLAGDGPGRPSQKAPDPQRPFAA